MEGDDPLFDMAGNRGPTTLTNDEKLLEFAGVKWGHECPVTIMPMRGGGVAFRCECGHCSGAGPDGTWARGKSHTIPMPALTGDFRDHVAMECLRRLPSLRLSRTPEISDEPWRAHSWGTVTLVRGKDPTDAIFAAVLAYLAQQEG